MAELTDEKVREALEQFKSSFEGIKEKTVKNYLVHINRYLNWCAARNLDPLVPEVAKAFYCFEYHAKGKKLTSRKEAATVLERFLRGAGLKVKMTRSELDGICSRLEKEVDLEVEENVHRVLDILKGRREVGELPRPVEEVREHEEGTEEKVRVTVLFFEVKESKLPSLIEQLSHRTSPPDRGEEL